uniref:DNA TOPOISOMERASE IV, B SUBUNIT n=1 Tax=Myoviridae sp. ctkfK18 TaxID=2825165 RepID=A0A8S5VGA0_9CAUD|nr:MAG TPA: DNA TOPOISOMERASE IV, B SUBUNIT [Myoviridae sp. ctkfK18]
MDSAAGTVKNARDSRFQAVFPLRGKIINAEKHNEIEVYNNKEIKDLIISLGCGVKDDFDIKKLKYHKIILENDMDADGAAISLLLITFFFRYMPEVIINGHLFIGPSPLFINTIGKQKYFTYDEKEQEDFLLKHKNDKISDIQRIKGLGELNADIFREQVMNPKTRRLLQVKIDDFEKESEIIHMLQGNDSTHRKRLIETGEL